MKHTEKRLKKQTENSYKQIARAYSIINKEKLQITKRVLFYTVRKVIII